jgi:hypothetical protein
MKRTSHRYSCDFRNWHFSDLARERPDLRSRRNSGHCGGGVSELLPVVSFRHGRHCRSRRQDASRAWGLGVIGPKAG